MNGGDGPRPVAYGDHVRLMMPSADGLLGGEGVLNSECRLLRSNINRQDKCVFRICMAFQYVID
jgi:hypothetical protein